MIGTGAPPIPGPVGNTVDHAGYSRGITRWTTTNNTDEIVDKASCRPRSAGQPAAPVDAGDAVGTKNRRISNENRRPSTIHRAYYLHNKNYANQPQKGWTT